MWNRFSFFWGRKIFFWLFFYLFHFQCLKHQSFFFSRVKSSIFCAVVCASFSLFVHVFQVIVFRVINNVLILFRFFCCFRCEEKKNIVKSSQRFFVLWRKFFFPSNRMFLFLMSGAEWPQLWHLFIQENKLDLRLKLDCRFRLFKTSLFNFQISRAVCFLSCLAGCY